jgi:hypothetical protein
LTELLNRDGDGPVITREWLDAVLDRQLPEVLTNLVRKQPVSVADFVKLAQLERGCYPPDTGDKPVTWVDYL